MSCYSFIQQLMQVAWLNQLNQVQFGKNFSYILPPLASQNYLLQSISVKLIYQFLYLIYGFLFFRCLEKVFEEERNKNKDGNSRGVAISQLLQKETGMMKFLALTSYLLARIKLTLISSFAITGCFQKVNFQGSNLVILNFELPSAFLYALCELFEKQAALCGNNSVLVKIRDSLLCVTNRYINVTSKLILPSISRFKFCPP